VVINEKMLKKQLNLIHISSDDDVSFCRLEKVFQTTEVKRSDDSAQIGTLLSCKQNFLKKQV
jgi:hypothetical protein